MYIMYICTLIIIYHCKRFFKKMVEGNFHAVFDAETYKKFVQIVGRGNVTRAFQDYMMNTICVQSKDVDGIDIQLVNMDISKLQKEISEKQAQLNEKVQLKTKYEANITEIERKKLEKQKAETERLSKCQNCGQILPEKAKRHKFNVGAICHACYMTADANSYQKWNTTQ